MVRVGVVGAGWFASRRHLPELVKHPEVDLVALCRRSEAPLRQLADHFCVEQTFTDYPTMLAEAELDAVLVCSPHHLHHEQAAAALEAGCHVLMEKPMAISSADARDLVRRADVAGRVLEVAYNPPYWSHCCWLRERVAAGDLGEIECVDLRWTGNIQGVFGREALPAQMPGVVPPTMFRGDIEANGGGHLIDGGSHQVCEAVWVTGLELADLSARMDSVPDDIRFSLQFTFANGAMGTITSIGDSQRPGRQVMSTYLGSKASAIVRGMPNEILWLEPDAPPRVYTEADLPEPPQPVASFIAAVQGHGAPRSPGRDCVRYVAAIEAAYASAADGQRKSLE